MPERFVADTAVLIDYGHDDPDAVAVISESAAGGLVFVHPVSVLEMLQGVLNRRHLGETLSFLAAFRRVHAKNADHEHAVQLMVEHHLSHGIGWPDCLIAATCIRLALPLVTLNDKHFRPIRGLRVVRPY